MNRPREWSKPKIQFQIANLFLEILKLSLALIVYKCCAIRSGIVDEDITMTTAWSSAKTTPRACAVHLATEKSDDGKTPPCSSPGVTSRRVKRRHAFRRSQVATSRLTTSDVGLSLGLAYARFMHSVGAPIMITLSFCQPTRNTKLQLVDATASIL